MKYLVALILVFSYNISFSQSFETTNGVRVNYTDSLGLKQGYWKEKKKYSTKGLIIEERRIEQKLGLDSVYHTVAEGSYIDQKKVGVWKDYGDNWHLISVVREIVYLENGSIVEKNFIENSKIKYSADTSKVNGYLVLKGDSLQLTCKKQKCTFTVDNGNEFHAFDFNNKYDFFLELVRLKNGMYDRRIEEIKSNR